MKPTSILAEGSSIAVASGDRLDVRHFTVSERISSLFVVTLVAHCQNPSVEFNAVVGHPARFSLRAGLQARSWSGLCSRLQQIAVEESGASTYHVEVVPALWLATQRRNYRMFQQQSELEIVLDLLAEWGITPVKKLGATYKKRKYRVQYAESDFAFLCRMLEDAGIAFYFEQHGDESKMVLSDAPQTNEPRALPIAYRDKPTSSDREHVTAVRIGQQVRPGRVTLRDHDYRLPSDYKLLADAAAGREVEQQLEQFHYVPGAFLFGSDKGEASPVADDRGKTRTDEAEGKVLAQKRLDAVRGSAMACSFETNALDLVPGVVMSMLDHPHADLAAGKKLLVVESSISGSGSSLTHHCEARSASSAYRPEPVTPRPRAQGVESATVVGPKGAEIHTDEFGRVRVHFHWDRESRMDEKSSCWIHVSQSWGGAGYGGTNLPRVGQEVLVDFIGGDPDRPVITGRLYTNLQKTPYKLPDNKTQSGWKSNSTGGSGGYNEIMFEDAGGQELLRMQAEKDMHKLVKNDEQSTVGRNRTRRVKGNEEVTVHKNRTKRVVKNEQVVIGKSQSISVGGNRAVQVGGIDSTMVGDTHVVTVSPPGEGGHGPVTSATMSHKKMVFDTGMGAKITMDGPVIALEATLITLTAKAQVAVGSDGITTVGGLAGLNLGSAGGSVAIDGGPMVKINGAGGMPAGRLGDPTGGVILDGSATVLIGGPKLFPFKVSVDCDGNIKVGDHVIVKPGTDPEFQAKVMRDLARMAMTSSGLTRLNNIEKNPGKHNVTIREFSESEARDYGANNSVTYARTGWFGLGHENQLGVGSLPGSGSDSEIGYYPDIKMGPAGFEPEPADATLFHEMGHAEHNAYGVSQANTPKGNGWTDVEEWQTIEGGVNKPGGANALPVGIESPTENDYLDDRGYPYHRADHGRDYVNADGTPISNP